MKKDIENKLKSILANEVENLEQVYKLHLEMKKYLKERNKTLVQDTVNKVIVILDKFKEHEQARIEIWEEFVKGEKFESTYEAVEKLCMVHKKEILNLLHKFKINLINLRNLSYLIQNHVDTSMDMLEMIFLNFKEDSTEFIYKNPYGPKSNINIDSNILINKKL